MTATPRRRREPIAAGGRSSEERGRTDPPGAGPSAAGRRCAGSGRLHRGPRPGRIRGWVPILHRWSCRGTMRGLSRTAAEAKMAFLRVTLPGGSPCGSTHGLSARPSRGGQSRASVRGPASEPGSGISRHATAPCGTPRVSLVCHSEVFPLLRGLRAKITQIYEGTNQVQRIVMARHLLSRNG